jgi:translation elongation factor EF-Tu-like GTPase
MFEIEVKDIFRITGRGIVIAGEIIRSETNLRNGDTLINKENIEQKIFVKSIEMINYGSRRKINLNHIGLLTDITEEVGKTLLGKRLYKE